MKKPAALLAALIVVYFLGAAIRADAEFRAGIAVRVITPDPLLPVSGGAGTPEPASTLQDDLTARALVIENGGVRMAICSVDLIGFPGVLCNRVRERATSVPAPNILIGSTHTHSAPDPYGIPNPDGTSDCDLAYLDMVCTKLAEAIEEAVDKLQPAGLKIATGKAEGKIAYNYYAEKLYDPRCHVIQAVAADGTPIATLINYATHPEVIGPDQGMCGPDLVGPLYDRIEERGGGVGIFMNSAQGGMVTADCRGPDGKDIQTWDECIRIGNLMADEALRIVSSAPVQPNPALFCAATEVQFPVETELLQGILELSPLKFPKNADGTVSAQVNVVNVGNAQILTIPGEALPNIGFYLKRKMHGEHNFLFGLTNEAFGYILAKEDWNSFDRYNYISRTSLGEMTGEIFTTAALAFVDTCPVPEKSAP